MSFQMRNPWTMELHNLYDCPGLVELKNSTVLSFLFLDQPWFSRARARVAGSSGKTHGSVQHAQQKLPGRWWSPRGGHVGVWKNGGRGGRGIICWCHPVKITDSSGDFQIAADCCASLSYWGMDEHSEETQKYKAGITDPWIHFIHHGPWWRCWTKWGIGSIMIDPHLEYQKSTGMFLSSICFLWNHLESTGIFFEQRANQVTSSWVQGANAFLGSLGPQHAERLQRNHRHLEQDRRGRSWRSRTYGERC